MKVDPKSIELKLTLVNQNEAMLNVMLNSC